MAAGAPDSPRVTGVQPIGELPDSGTITAAAAVVPAASAPNPNVRHLLAMVALPGVKFGKPDRRRDVEVKRFPGCSLVSARIVRILGTMEITGLACGRAAGPAEGHVDEPRTARRRVRPDG